MNNTIFRKQKAMLAGAIATVMLLFYSSCGIDKSLNNSPNAAKESDLPTISGLNALTVGMQAGIADFYSADRARYCAIWTWQVVNGLDVRNQLKVWNDYIQDFNVNEVGISWQNGFQVIKAANDVIRIAPRVDIAPTTRNTYIGIALCHKALVVGEMAALWGSIPIPEPTNDNPYTATPFVNQEQAYNRAQAFLDSAITLFSAGMAEGNFTADLNYGSNGAAATKAALWIATARSLKARYFLHVKNYASALAQANQGITSNNGNFLGVYNGANANELAQFAQLVQNEQGTPMLADKYFMDRLKNIDVGAIDAGKTDTRLARYFAPSALDSARRLPGYAYVPVRFASGSATETDERFCARLNPAEGGYGNTGTSFPLITATEVRLIRAECLARTEATTANAVTALNPVREGAGLGVYGGATTSVAVIADILRQKYLALFLEGQSYHDMRRTATLPSRTPTEGRAPLRFRYPLTEISARPTSGALAVPADANSLVNPLLAPEYIRP
jgi:starch-binding outer membrane protein, SusD/RagB family